MIKRIFIVFGAFILASLLAACGATAESSTGGQANNTGGQVSNTTVQVTETDYHIASSVTSFTPGITYHFVITNKSPIVHEFMIMPKSEGNMTGTPMSQMDKMAMASVENIEPGETKMLDFTFPASVANSHPQFVCYKPGHYEAGMHLNVAVK
jgi:uncharacterized cupredoxin-like copper-binding protein